MAGRSNGGHRTERFRGKNEKATRQQVACSRRNDLFNPASGPASQCFPLWVRLARRFPLHLVWLGGMVAAVAAFVWAFLLGEGQLAAFALICVLSGVAFGADLALPPALLAAEKRAAFYREWMDSFFARDIQRLFGFRDMNRFNALLEYLLRQSGGQFEATRTASALGISRPTVESHLSALEITRAVTVVRPFHGGGQNEIVRQPKVYAFDTGFVSFARGWDPLRPDDCGPLWEHLVLEHLQARFPDTPVRYWRDKPGHEVDFVIARRRDEVDAIECKWDPGAFDRSALERFRRHYPRGDNYLVTPSGDPAYTRRYGKLDVRVCTPSGLRP